jgi:hypothetical protein
VAATNGLALPIPELTDTADGPDGFSDLANAVEDYFFDRILPVGVTRYPGHSWGSVTGLPTTGTKLGDTCYHTGLKSFMVCLTDGGGTWRQLRPGIVTNEVEVQAIADNGALNTLLHQGFTLEATATKARAVWDGTRFIWFDRVWQTYTPVVAVGGTNTWTPGNSTVIGRYLRKGREVSVENAFVMGSTANFNAAASFVSIVPPAGLMPAHWVEDYTISPPCVGSVEVVNGANAWGFIGVFPSATPAARRFVFYNAAGAALSSGAGTAGSWNLWTTGQRLRFMATYETNYES